MMNKWKFLYILCFALQNKLFDVVSQVSFLKKYFVCASHGISQFSRETEPEELVYILEKEMHSISLHNRRVTVQQ